MTDACQSADDFITIFTVPATGKRIDFVQPHSSTKKVVNFSFFLFFENLKGLESVMPALCMTATFGKTKLLYSND